MIPITLGKAVTSGQFFHTIAGLKADTESGARRQRLSEILAPCDYLK